MLQRLDSVASDSRCPNSPLIDFNGEILISFWPRSASKGQIICWGNAGHSVPWSQSIILTGSTKEKRKKKKKPGEASADTSTIRTYRQSAADICDSNMNTNDVFIEWECSANHS